MELEEIKNKIKSKTKDMECPVFRGQANAKCMLNSGAIRRLVKACGYDFILWKNKPKTYWLNITKNINFTHGRN